MRETRFPAANFLAISTTLGGFALCLAASSVVRAQLPEQPVRLELLINGESFTIDTDQATTLKSEKPNGPKYQLAARIAQYQPWKLNSLSLEFHRGFAIDDDEGKEIRTATFRHRLGFVMTVSDLGGTLDEPGKRKVLDLLVEAATASIQAEGGEDLQTSAPAVSKFGNVAGLGVTIRSKQRGVPQRSIVYVLSGEKFAATAVVQFLDADQANVVPLVKPTLQSLVPLK